MIEDDDKILKRIPIEMFYPKEDRCRECKLEIQSKVIKEGRQDQIDKERHDGNKKERKKKRKKK